MAMMNGPRLELGRSINLIDTASTRRKKQILDDICSELGVRFREGSFEIELEDVSDISSAVMRLSQAYVRVSAIFSSFAESQ